VEAFKRSVRRLLRRPGIESGVQAG
jgi:hypothetical protein